MSEEVRSGAPAGSRLSPKTHWDETFQHVVLPRVITPAQYNYFRFDQLFKTVLPRPKGSLRFLEVGCGASAWLVYFAKEFGYEVAGIDYSEFGCKLAEENLRLNGVSGNIVCKDIFEITPATLGPFDLVFSYGVIEHFHDPSALLRIMYALLKPGGLVIAVVPNMAGIYGFLQRTVNDSVFRMHTIVDRARMTDYLGNSGFDAVFVNYFGTLYFPVVNWSKPARLGWIMRHAGQIVSRVDAASSYVLRRLALRAESRTFSPYVVGIGARR